MLEYWSNHIFFAVKAEDILPPQGQKNLTQVHGDDYLILKELAQLFHSYLIKDNTTIIPSHPRQGLYFYLKFHADAMFYYNYQGWLFNTIYNFGKKKFQDVFIQHFYYCIEVLQIAKDECQSLNLDYCHCPSGTSACIVSSQFSGILARFTDMHCSTRSKDCCSRHPSCVNYIESDFTNYDYDEVVLDNFGVRMMVMIWHNWKKLRMV